MGLRFLLIGFILLLNPALNVSAQDVPASIISSAEYKLPGSATAAGIDGTMKIAITVDKKGVVKGTRILGGPSWPCGSEPEKELKGVREDVKQIVSAAKFSPAMKNGKPVDSDLLLTFMIGDAYKAAVKQHEAEEAVRS